jgi:hypothetical protein
VRIASAVLTVRNRWARWLPARLAAIQPESFHLLIFFRLALVPMRMCPTSPVSSDLQKDPDVGTTGCPVVSRVDARPPNLPGRGVATGPHGQDLPSQQPMLQISHPQGALLRQSTAPEALFHIPTIARMDPRNDLVEVTIGHRRRRGVRVLFPWRAEPADTQ